MPVVKIRVMQPYAKERLQPPESGGSKEWILPRATGGRVATLGHLDYGPVMLIWTFWTLEVWENVFYCFKTFCWFKWEDKFSCLVVVIICYSSHRKLVQEFNRDFHCCLPQGRPTLGFEYIQVNHLLNKQMEHIYTLQKDMAESIISTMYHCNVQDII